MRFLSDCIVVAGFLLSVASTAILARAQSLSGANVRVSTHDFFPTDPFFAPSGPPDVLQQNEPSIAVHPSFPNLISVGMNDVRTLAVSGCLAGARRFDQMAVRLLILSR